MYKYGVSFNCQGNERGFEVGGGGEGCTSVDFVGNDLEKIEKAMVEYANESEVANWSAHRKHEYVGQGVEVGGKVLSVIGYPWDENDPEEGTYDLCVIFEYDNTGPTAIE